MKNLALLSIILLLSACSPTLNYLGDNYPPTNKVDVYYDEGDIKREFKVIGQLTGDNVNTTVDLNDVKDGMIEEAKMRGANGIWFLYSDSFDNDHIIKSKLILYTN